MIATPATIKRTYYALLLGNTLAASLIWGINTLFLLDAGLSNLEAFAANAFFTAGMVLFEVPTGIVADTWGRRVSFLLGTITLSAATALYVMLWRLEAPFWQWAIVSVLLGLGFTFFSGATEAWLVDALQATGYATARRMASPVSPPRSSRAHRSPGGCSRRGCAGYSRVAPRRCSWPKASPPSRCS